MRNKTTKVMLSLMMISTVSLLNLGYAATSKDFNCLMTDVFKDHKAGEVKKTFTPKTGEIILLCDTTAVKKGDNLKAVWYLVNAQGAKEPINQKIVEKVLPVEQDVPPGLVYTSNMSLSKPEKDWPVGVYRVDLFLNNDKINSFDFDVK